MKRAKSTGGWKSSLIRSLPCPHWGQRRRLPSVVHSALMAALVAGDPIVLLEIEDRIWLLEHTHGQPAHQRQVALVAVFKLVWYLAGAADVFNREPGEHGVVLLLKLVGCVLHGDHGACAGQVVAVFETYVEINLIVVGVIRPHKHAQELRDVGGSRLERRILRNQAYHYFFHHRLRHRHVKHFAGVVCAACP